MLQCHKPKHIRVGVEFQATVPLVLRWQSKDPNIDENIVFRPCFGSDEKKMKDYLGKARKEMLMIGKVFKVRSTGGRRSRFACISEILDEEQYQVFDGKSMYTLDVQSCFSGEEEDELLNIWYLSAGCQETALRRARGFALQQLERQWKFPEVRSYFCLERYKNEIEFGSFKCYDLAMSRSIGEVVAFDQIFSVGKLESRSGIALSRNILKIFRFADCICSNKKWTSFCKLTNGNVEFLLCDDNTLRRPELPNYSSQAVRRMKRLMIQGDGDIGNVVKLKKSALNRPAAPKLTSSDTTPPRSGVQAATESQNFEDILTTSPCNSLLRYEFSSVAAASSADTLDHVHRFDPSDDSSTQSDDTERKLFVARRVRLFTLQPRIL